MILRALAVLVVAAPWVVLALMGREIVPASIERTDRLFALTLGLTWFGLWLLAVGVARSRREMIFRAVGTTAAVLAMLALLELPAALHRIHWEIVFRSLAGEGRDYGSTYVQDTLLIYRRIPELTWSGRVLSDVEGRYQLPRSAQEPITFTYDRWGYRNAVDMEHADVVLIGDSYVEGWYVDDRETVAARLTERLGVPVANLGVAGYGTLQELEVLRRDGLARRPRTVVWFFFEGNDLYDDQTFENARLAGPPSTEQVTPHGEGLAASHGWKRRSFTLNALRWLRRISHPVVPNRAPYWAYRRGERGDRARVYFADYAGVPWTDYERDRWRVARGALEDGVALARAAGVEVAFVYAPIKFRVYRDVIDPAPGSPLLGWSAWDDLPVLFRQFCEDNAVRCLDLTDGFRTRVRQGVEVFARTDTHWGPAGHELAAEQVAALLGRPAENAGAVTRTR